MNATKIVEGVPERSRGPTVLPHQIVDMLPDERLDDALDYLAELSEPDQPLSAETQAAIEEGLNDIRRGRTISLSE